MSVWKRYRAFVESNVSSGIEHQFEGVDYWRDQLFTVIIVFMFPVLSFAYVPAMIVSLRLGYSSIAFYDTIALVIILVITFARGISIKWRKRLFVTTIYLLATSLLYYMGAYGPGLLYLLATVIFVGLFYSSKFAYWCIVLNTVICLLFSLLMHLDLLGSYMVTIFTPEAWLAVAANQFLLSILFASAIDMLTTGLNTTLQKEKALREKIKEEAIESKKLVKDLKSKNEELEQFAYIASHDLQEPLSTILGVTELLKLENVKNDEKEYQQSLQFIYGSVERLRSLIKGLLDYSRIGRQLNTGAVNCYDMVKNVVSELDNLITEHHAKVVLDQSVKVLPKFMAYPLELNQLFQNLVINAVKFSREGISPEVHISVKDEGSFNHFVIADNGIGMKAESIKDIFIIFKRAHSDKKFKGSGIGLAFCKKIVDLHGGSIWAESAPGKGSKFHFTISKSISQ